MDFIIAGSIVFNMLNFGEQRGLQRAELLQKTGIDGANLCAQNAQIPLSQALHLWETLAYKTKDPEVGLHQGEMYNLAAIGLVGMLAQNSQNVRVALQHVCNYSNLLSNALHMQVVEKGSTFRLRFDLAPIVMERSPNAAKHLIAATLVFALKELQHLVGQAIAPKKIGLHFADPEDAAYQRIFGDNIYFGSSSNYLEFEREVLGKSVHFADYELLGAVEKIASKRLEEMADQLQTITARVHYTILSQLNPTFPSIDQVASILNISVRTLQRKLKAEETSYSQVLDDLKRELSLNYLQKEYTTAEVTYLMGYAEPSAFIHAFRKWYGQSPTKYLAEQHP